MHWMIKVCVASLVLTLPTLAHADDDDVPPAPEALREARQAALHDAERAVDEARRVVRKLKRRKPCPTPPGDPDTEE